MSDQTQIPSGKAEGLEKSFTVDSLRVNVFRNQEAMSAAATIEVGDYLAGLLEKQSTVKAILATGNSQIQFLSKLIERDDIDWSRIELFHMDEYLGLPADHSASFRRYMKERVETLVKPKIFHYLEGDALLPLDECQRYSDLLSGSPVDLCCLGVGENGHIAFNDPPVANFNDPHHVKLVKLDDACKKQQVGEGHFPSLEAVPSYAMTLTIPALCSAKKMICLAPESRKSQAVKSALQNPVSTECPASYLRTQPQAQLFLDVDSSALL